MTENFILPLGFKAGLVKNNHKSGPLPGAESLEIWENTEENFTVKESYNLAQWGLGKGINQDLDMKKMEDICFNLSLKLADLKLLGALKFSGLIKQRLLNMKNLLLLEGDFEDNLWPSLAEEVWSSQISNQDQPDPDGFSVGPQEVSPGNYYVDLTQALNLHPELSTKKILMPFLQRPDFQKLTIKFSHLPPWLPEAAGNLGRSIVTENSNDCQIISIY